jgi:molybdopterin-guanine dinucleotide biosynthesis protein A
MHPASENRISVAILAGGAGRRFGDMPKALIPRKDGTIISYLVKQFSPLSDDLLIISNHPDLYHHLNLPVYPDLIPGKGPLSGIHSALSHAKYSSVLIMACDMPLLRTETAKPLTDAWMKFPDHALIPSGQNGTEPLFSLWPGKLLAALDQWLISDNKPKIMDFLVSTHRMIQVDYPEISSYHNVFMNINTPSDLNKLRHFEDNQTTDD